MIAAALQPFSVPSSQRSAMPDGSRWLGSLPGTAGWQESGTRWTCASSAVGAALNHRGGE
jgi:hypothetical protein